ncbi:KEOPS complex N(6)-L-threonylcarbamoyladenine synthase Kae1 [Sulfodiicoccus acidiphilus]|nr:KEOPS complex N(6)-L-threonylcarbamoyladenine synthase Kae1 [Sulfodiicoccus acidiphilus]
MKVLGIESTAHTLGVGVVADHSPYVLSNVKDTFVPREGGMRPGEVSHHHAEVAPKIVKESLREARLTIKEIDYIAVSIGPGLGPALRVGATLARALSLKYRKPLVGVNHGVAHIEIGYFSTGAQDPLVVYLSGGNTVITSLVEGRFRTFGETLDIALGNMFDTFVREAGLAPPYIINGRHMIDICAEEGENFIDLPYVVKGQDVSYSGILTAALKALKSHRRGDVCFSLREVAFDVLLEAVERALALTKKKEILVVGGVAASASLKEKLNSLADSWGVELKVVPPYYAGDNGAMIAYTGLQMAKHGAIMNIEESHIRPRWRVDEVDIVWR